MEGQESELSEACR